VDSFTRAARKNCDELRCKIALEEVLDMPVDLLVRRFQEDSPIARIAKGQGQRLE
jgi:hypothetical protein